MKLLFNMQLLFWGIFSMLISSLNAQTLTPVRQLESEKPYGWVPVILSKKELLEAGRLSALYPEDKKIDTTLLQIKQYQISIFHKSRKPDNDMHFYSPVEDRFPKGLPETILSLMAGDKIFFESVKAWKKDGTEKKLRSIPALSVTLSDN